MTPPPVFRVLCSLWILFVSIDMCSCFYVDGNLIKDSNGNVARLRGVDRSGPEYACLHGNIFDGPSDAKSVEAIKSWNVNIVRIPLNEDCWLGINGVDPRSSGYIYQRSIVDFVNLLGHYGIAAIIDLQWTAPGSTLANGQQPMPDMDHSVDFWKSAANTFKNNTDVIFDVFNEPYPDNQAWDSTEGWTCWRDGGNCTGIPFEVAGMHTLVAAIRSTGAKNIAMLGGLKWSNSLTQWLSYAPLQYENIVASWHSYNFNYCVHIDCWNSVVAPVAAKVPVIAGEIGENDCSSDYIEPLMKWMDQHGMHYLGWAWDTYSCEHTPALIVDYNGTATNYGLGLKNHFTASTQN